MRLLLLIAALLLLLDSPARAQDPALDFVVLADSVATAGGDEALAGLVRERPQLVGAAVGFLLDIAHELRAAGDDAAATENVDFARRLARLYEGEGPARQLAAWDGLDAAARQRRARAARHEAVADSLRAAGDPDAAVAELESAREIYREIGDLRALAVVHGTLGIAHWYRGDWPAVFASYRDALPPRRLIDDQLLVGRTLNGLGSAHFSTSQLDSALYYYRAAAELRESTGDLAGLGTSLTYAGNVHLQLGDNTRARELYLRALPVLERTAPPGRVVESLVGIANLYATEGRLAEASARYERALELAQQEEGAPKAPQVLVNLSEVDMQRGRPERALARLGDALAQLDGQPNPTVRLDALRVRSKVHMQLGERDAARADLLAMVALARELGDPGSIVDSQIELGQLYLAFGAPDRALAAAATASALADTLADPRRQRDTAMLAGQAHEAMADLAAAAESFERARDLDEQSGARLSAAEDEISLGNVHARAGEGQAARAAFRRALAIHAEAGRRDMDYIALAGLGHSFESSRPDSARWYYERALASIDADRDSWSQQDERTSFLAFGRGEAFEGIAWFYARQHARAPRDGWDEFAFAASEHAKAWGLRHQLGDDEATSVSSLEELSRQLPRGEVVLSYSVGDSASLLFAVARGQRQLHLLPRRAELTGAVRRLRDAVARPGAGDQELLVQAERLGGWLLGPARSLLQGADRVTIAADGVLHELPVELLLLGPAAGGGLGQQPWLGRHLATRYVPAASFRAREARARSRHGGGLLAVAVADFSAVPPRDGEEPLPPLPHVEEELEAVAGMHPSPRRLSGSAATEAAVREAIAQSPPAILHLATHGLLDPVEPARSAVVLLPGGGEDGYLEAGEIAGLDLPCQLVVLSACESGRGRIERGEGVLGLTRSFLAAGAANVLGSLWAVNDESTARLMRSFHAGLGGGDLAGALQRARRAMLEDAATEHPFHWGAFVLTGSGS